MNTKFEDALEAHRIHARLARRAMIRAQATDKDLAIRKARFKLMRAHAVEALKHLMTLQCELGHQWVYERRA